jgi:hypothetical protein
VGRGHPLLSIGARRRPVILRERRAVAANCENPARDRKTSNWQDLATCAPPPALANAILAF